VVIALHQAHHSCREQTVQLIAAFMRRHAVGVMGVAMVHVFSRGSAF
jgi:hypothetical protein